MSRGMALALGGLVVVMALVLLARQPDDNAGASAHFLPGLKSQLGELQQVTLRAGDKEVVLENQQGVWHVSQRDDYVANLAELQEMIGALADARILERKTAKPENHERLGLDADAALHVTLTAPDYQQTIVLGSESNLGEGVFVRLADESQTWLIDRVVNASADPASWLTPVILDIDPEAMREVTLFAANGDQVMRLHAAPEADNLVLENLPEGRTLRYETITNTFRRALVNVRLQDVALHDESRWQTARRAEFVHDAAQVSVFAQQVDDQYWIHITGYSDDVALWDYSVASHIYDGFTKDLEDLLAPVSD